MWSLWDHKILIGNAKQEGDCTLEGGILREPWFPYFCAKCIFDCTMTDTRKKASRGDYEKEQEIEDQREAERIQKRAAFKKEENND